MKIIDQVVDALQRHPHINRVFVSGREMEEMRSEYLDLLPGAPYVGEERSWMLLNARYHPFYIMGRPVEIAG